LRGGSWCVSLGFFSICGGLISLRLVTVGGYSMHFLLVGGMECDLFWEVL
jgi:hypothetical protein